MGQKRKDKFAAKVDKKARGDCKFLGNRVCNGSIVKTFKFSKLVRICQDGKLSYKKSKDVPDAVFRAAERKTSKKGEEEQTVSG